jgi:hypothetical protein
MMEPALLLLVEHGFLALQAPSTQDGKLGRPAGPSYEVNPHLYIHNLDAQNPQNPQKGNAEGGFEGFEDFEIQEAALNGTHHSAMHDGKRSDTPISASKIAMNEAPPFAAHTPSNGP